MIKWAYNGLNWFWRLREPHRQGSESGEHPGEQGFPISKSPSDSLAMALQLFHLPSSLLGSTDPSTEKCQSITQGYILKLTLCTLSLQNHSSPLSQNQVSAAPRTNTALCIQQGFDYISFPSEEITCSSLPPPSGYLQTEQVSKSHSLLCLLHSSHSFHFHWNHFS